MALLLIFYVLHFAFLHFSHFSHFFPPNVLSFPLVLGISIANFRFEFFID